MVSKYTPQHVAKDFPWLSNRCDRRLFVWKRGESRLAHTFRVIVVPTPSAGQPRLAVASFRPFESRVAMLLQHHAGRGPSANDIGKAHAAQRGESDFLGKSILSFRNLHPA